MRIILQICLPLLGFTIQNGLADISLTNSGNHPNYGRTEYLPPPVQEFPINEQHYYSTESEKKSRDSQKIRDLNHLHFLGQGYFPVRYDVGQQHSQYSHNHYSNKANEAVNGLSNIVYNSNEKVHQPQPFQSYNQQQSEVPFSGPGYLPPNYGRPAIGNVKLENYNHKVVTIPNVIQSSGGPQYLPPQNTAAHNTQGFLPINYKPHTYVPPNPSLKGSLVAETGHGEGHLSKEKVNSNQLVQPIYKAPGYLPPIGDAAHSKGYLPPVSSGSVFTHEISQHRSSLPSHNHQPTATHVSNANGKIPVPEGYLSSPKNDAAHQHNSNSIHHSQAAIPQFNYKAPGYLPPINFNVQSYLPPNHSAAHINQRNPQVFQTSTNQNENFNVITVRNAVSSPTGAQYNPNAKDDSQLSQHNEYANGQHTGTSHRTNLCRSTTVVNCNTEQLSKLDQSSTLNDETIKSLQKLMPSDYTVFPVTTTANASEILMLQQQISPGTENIQSGKIRTVQIINNSFPNTIKTLKILEVIDKPGVTTIKILGPTNDEPMGDHQIFKIIGSGSHSQEIKIFSGHTELPIRSSNVQPILL